MAMPALASAPPESAVSSICKRPDYPRRAQQAEEEGVVVAGFLQRADGTVAESVILNSTGSRALDNATVAAFSECVFRPAERPDAPARWVRVTYVWQLEGDPDWLRAKSVVALAASKGRLPARYHLSLLLWTSAKNDAEREDAMRVLHSAAKLGHAHAQYDLGQRYEKGDGVEADLAEALRWYEKSAAQGDPLAKQRLALGKLPD